MLYLKLMLQIYLLVHKKTKYSQVRGEINLIDIMNYKYIWDVRNNAQ